MTTYSDDLSDHRLAEMSDMDRLWWSQFGNRIELGVRVASVAVVGILLWIYEGNLVAPVWLLSYLIPLAICYISIHPKHHPVPFARHLGLASYVMFAVAYAALPIYLLASPDPVLMFCATFGIIILGLFTLMREEPPAIVAPLDIAIGWVAITMAGAAHILQADSTVARIMMGVLCVVSGGYYTRALISTRKVRVGLRAAAHRSLKEKQMEAIGKVSGGIAHDFNNILTALKGSLELYHEVPQGPERDALVDEANQAGARASWIVSQLLAFSQRALLTPGAVPVDDVINEAAADARHRLPHGIRIDTRVPDHPVRVRADADALQAALSAMIDNAFDAMGHHGTLVLAADLADGPASDGRSTAARDAAGAHLSLSVADDGTGMTPAVAERATEPFFTTKVVGQGSGLGLSMAAGFAAQSDGTLRIKSGDGGTIVAIHLPIAAADQ